MKKSIVDKWENLPINIQKVMVKNYIRELNSDINKNTVKLAIRDFKVSILGGFYWDFSPEGPEFWRNILLGNNIINFRQYYIKNTIYYLIDYGYF